MCVSEMNLALMKLSEHLRNLQQRTFHLQFPFQTRTNEKFDTPFPYSIRVAWSELQFPITKCKSDHVTLTYW